MSIISYKNILLFTWQLYLLWLLITIVVNFDITFIYAINIAFKMWPVHDFLITKVKPYVKFVIIALIKDMSEFDQN